MWLLIQLIVWSISMRVIYRYTAGKVPDTKPNRRSVVISAVCVGTFTPVILHQLVLAFM